MALQIWPYGHAAYVLRNSFVVVVAAAVAVVVAFFFFFFVSFYNSINVLKEYICVFSRTTKNVKRRSKIALFSNECHLTLNFPK